MHEDANLARTWEEKQELAKQCASAVSCVGPALGSYWSCGAAPFGVTFGALFAAQKRLMIEVPGIP